MKRIFAIFIAGLAASFSIFAATAPRTPMEVKTFTLSNGLTVWLNEDPNQRSAFGAVVVKAGAADCPGTGIAHYFEHMMFKGTDKINTIDYEAEKVYLDSIVVMYDSLAMTSDESVRKDIQMEINRLSIKAADYAVPNEFDNLIAEMGGANLNAFTSYDETVYHNKFLPEYFAQWAELNSERIINPVFRLFQSELETVYEEKNRSNDNLVSDMQEKLLSSVFEGTGYADDVLGTTENLKNPRLSQMAQFFDEYYVAGNMGLILTGNLKEAEVRPILEKTFGRVRKGTAPARPVWEQQPIVGRKDIEAMINLPIVKIGAVSYRTPAAADPDALGFDLIASMLNNESQTGLFDKLMVDNKIMMAMGQTLTLKDNGAFLILYMPKLLFQSEEKATGYILDAIGSIRRGEFSDEFFESCKVSFKKSLMEQMESLENRAVSLAFAFANGQSWEDFIAQPERIDAMTREDIVALANKYLGDNYILMHKKKGLAPSNKLPKPDYEKVVPKNKDKASAYAINLRKEVENVKIIPTAVDFEKDVQTAQAAPLVKVYACQNPYNDIFNLTLTWRIGMDERPELERTAQYVNLLGTAGKSFDEIHNELHRLGAGFGFGIDDDNFTLTVSGFDQNFEETLSLAADVLKNIKPEGKKLFKCRTEESSGIIMNRRDMDMLVTALKEKVCFGEHSALLANRGKFNSKTLLGAFADAQKVECDVTYSGGLTAEEVATALAGKLDLDQVTVAAKSPIDFAPVKYEEPKIFFLNKKDASQSQINAIIVSDPIPGVVDRYFNGLFMSYLGGGMSSLLFQEIREFRSMAYSTYATSVRPVYRNAADIDVIYRAFVGTQCDKTLDAMEIVDSLLTKTPFQEERIALTKKDFLNTRCNAYPGFRERPGSVAEDIRFGFTYDPVPEFMEVIETSDAATLKDFWEKNISGRDIVWCIVGNKSKIDMDALAKVAPITFVKPKDVIR